MALEGNGTNGMVMPVSPMYGGGYGGNGMFGNGDNWLWFVLLILLCGNNGWGNGGYAGNGGGNVGMGGLYPWMNQSDHINDISTQLCGGFAGVTEAINTGFANAETAAAARQMANMQQMFGVQTAMGQGFNQVGTGISDLKYTVATENCADRTAAYQNTRDIIDNQNRVGQGIMDKLCALELDGVKNQLAQAHRENTSLQNQLNMMAMRESQANQNALIQQGLTNEVDALYNRLNNCPVKTVPVYGSQPIYTCNNNGFGCGCNA